MDRIVINYEGDVNSKVAFRMFKNKQSGKEFPVAVCRVDSNNTDIDFLNDLFMDHVSLTQSFDYVFDVNETSLNDILDMFKVRTPDEFHNEVEDYIKNLSFISKFGIDMNDTLNNLYVSTIDIFNSIGTLFRAYNTEYRFQIVPYERNFHTFGLNIFKAEDRIKYKNHFAINRFDSSITLMDEYVSNADVNYIDVIFDTETEGEKFFAVLDSVYVDDVNYIDFAKKHYDFIDVESIDDEEELALRPLSQDSKNATLFDSLSDICVNNIDGAVADCHLYRDSENDKSYILMDMGSVIPIPYSYFHYDRNVISNIVSKKLSQIYELYGVKLKQKIGSFSSSDNLSSSSPSLKMHDLSSLLDTLEMDLMYHESFDEVKKVLDIVSLKVNNRLSIDLDDIKYICNSIVELVNDYSDRHIAIVSHGHDKEDSSTEAISLSIYECDDILDLSEKINVIKKLMVYDEFAPGFDDTLIFPNHDVYVEIEPRGEYILCTDIKNSDDFFLDDMIGKDKLYYMKKSVFDYFYNVKRDGVER